MKRNDSRKRMARILLLVKPINMFLMDRSLVDGISFPSLLAYLSNHKDPNPPPKKIVKGKWNSFNQRDPNWSVNIDRVHNRLTTYRRMGYWCRVYLYSYVPE